MTENKTTALKQFFQKFISFTEKDWELIEQKISIKTLKKGETFLSAGQVSKTLGFITKGLFRKYYIKEGNDINFWFYYENRFLVAYQSFLEQTPSKFYIEAIEDSEILILSYESIQKIYNISEEWQKYGRLISERMYIAHHKRIESLLFKDATTRYNDLIQEHPVLVQRLPQYHLASYLGIKPQSLSRIRKETAKK